MPPGVLFALIVYSIGVSLIPNVARMRNISNESLQVVLHANAYAWIVDIKVLEG